MTEVGVVRARAGRWTTDLEGDFALFLIGADVHRPWFSLRLARLQLRMSAMLRDLEQRPELGLLHHEQYLGRHGPMIIQYWRSVEQLLAYAADPDQRHAETWRAWFAQGGHRQARLGIWHETYRVRAGEFEAVAQGMPPMGLLATGNARTVGAGGDTASLRMRSRTR